MPLREHQVINHQASVEYQRKFGNTVANHSADALWTYTRVMEKWDNQTDAGFVSTYQLKEQEQTTSIKHKYRSSNTKSIKQLKKTDE